MGIDRGFVGKQQFSKLLITALRRDVERCVSSTVSCVWIAVVPEQKFGQGLIVALGTDFAKGVP